ncbi:MAG: 4-hydroxy-3-methylbut-2-enyl diphosphate reductase [Bacteroidota bacterium]|nr:4-hydroxy-3-methylbut-2-enyl diphosphate reductase [Bacteroidota bacterium]
MKIVIDENSGFCFGVVYAIEMAEEILKQESHLYCLGDIVHNNKEVDRLSKLGLEVINHKKFKNLKDCKVLIRAHGEPPLTYDIALQNNIELLDASCPVVLKLQHQIREGAEKSFSINGQVIIFGKEGHAEVKGLLGHTKGDTIVVSSLSDLEKINFSKPIYIYSQTTKSPKAYETIIDGIKLRIKKCNPNNTIQFLINDTLCRQVSGREPELRKFSQDHDVVIFVSGKKSSNGRMLFEACKSENSKAYFISGKEELSFDWFTNINTVGVCGATSTPRWLMEEVSNHINFLAQ